MLCNNRLAAVLAVAFAMVCSLTAVASAGDWDELAKLIASDRAASDWFGTSLALDGGLVIVGAPGVDLDTTQEGAAYVYRYNGLAPPADAWPQQAKLIANDHDTEDHFGSAVSIEGYTAVIGAPSHQNIDAGKAYVFQGTTLGWSQSAKLAPGDFSNQKLFGSSVQIKGDKIIVGAPGDKANGPAAGAAYIFQDSGTGWVQVAKLLPGDGATDDHFGSSVSISGAFAIIGAHGDDDNGTDSGSAYIFQDTGSGWTQFAKLTASDGAAGDGFGYSVSIDGNTAIIGANRDDTTTADAGSAYRFVFGGSAWTEEQKLLPGDPGNKDYFGCSVAVDGELAHVGAYSNNDVGNDSGASYIFEDEGATWKEIAKLRASDEHMYDRFGIAVALSGQTAAIGANQQDDQGAGPQHAGAVYIVGQLPDPPPDPPPPPWIPEPSTLSLIALGGLCLLGVRKWRKNLTAVGRRE